MLGILLVIPLQSLVSKSYDILSMSAYELLSKWWQLFPSDSIFSGEKGVAPSRRWGLRTMKGSGCETCRHLNRFRDKNGSTSITQSQTSHLAWCLLEVHQRFREHLELAGNVNHQVRPLTLESESLGGAHYSVFWKLLMHIMAWKLPSLSLQPSLPGWASPICPRGHPPWFRSSSSLHSERLLFVVSVLHTFPALILTPHFCITLRP